MPDRPSRPTAPAASRGLLDTSVVIDIDAIDRALLPTETTISAVTLAELAAGPHAADDEAERRRRQNRLHWAVSQWDPLPLDADVARAYGRLVAARRAGGRSARSRFADFLIAATALAHGLPLYTRNPKDVRDVAHVVTLHSV